MIAGATIPGMPVGMQTVLIQSAGMDWTNTPTTVLGVLTTLGGGIILYLRSELKEVREEFRATTKDKEERILNLVSEKDQVQEKAREEMKEAFKESNDRYDRQLERSAAALEGIKDAYSELAAQYRELERQGNGRV